MSGLSPGSLVAAAVLTGYAPILIRTYAPDAVWWQIYFGILCWVAFKLLIVKNGSETERSTDELALQDSGIAAAS